MNNTENKKIIRFNTFGKKPKLVNITTTGKVYIPYDYHMPMIMSMIMESAETFTPRHVNANGNQLIKSYLHPTPKLKLGHGLPSLTLPTPPTGFVQISPRRTKESPRYMNYQTRGSKTTTSTKSSCFGSGI